MIDSNPVLWDIDLTPLLDVPVVIETEDGGRRNTIITGVAFHKIQFGELICPLPDRLILENDLNDFINVSVVKSVRRKQ